MIERSVLDVAEGARLVDQAGQTMARLVESVQKVTVIVGDMSVATAEQANGLEQINLAISAMDHVTQQNAALVEKRPRRRVR